MKPIAIDLFAGGGGTTLGLRRAGFDVRVAVDFDPHRADTLRVNHRSTLVLGARGTSGDIRNLQGKAILAAGGIGVGDLDLLVGCPPCQGFSLQGNRDVNDERNGLYLEFLRVVEEVEPKMVAFENVPGMTSFRSGAVLADLKGRLEDMDYSTRSWVLDAQLLGVPQARKRLFIIGSRVDAIPVKPANCRKTVGVWEAIADLPCKSYATASANLVPAKYRCEPRSPFAAKMRGKRASVMNCGRTIHSKDLVRRIRSLRWNERDKSTWHRRLHPKQAASTITAGSRSRTACRPIHPYADRVLTVREGARLASFPDWYVFPAHIAEAWSQIGNCVPPLMAERVFEQVRECL